MTVEQPAVNLPLAIIMVATVFVAFVILDLSSLGMLSAIMYSFHVVYVLRRVRPCRFEHVGLSVVLACLAMYLVSWAGRAGFRRRFYGVFR